MGCIALSSRPLSQELYAAYGYAHRREGMIVARMEKECADRIEKTPGAFGAMTLSLVVSENRGEPHRRRIARPVGVRVGPEGRVPACLQQWSLRQILRMFPDARLVVSSGCSSDPVMADHLAYGFRAVLPKPYRVEDFAKVLKRILAA